MCDICAFAETTAWKRLKMLQSQVAMCRSYRRPESLSAGCVLRLTALGVSAVERVHHTAVKEHKLLRALGKSYWQTTSYKTRSM